MLLNKNEDFLAAHARHLHIEQYDIIEDFLDEINCFGAVECEVNCIFARFLKLLLEESCKRSFVINDQYSVMLGHERTPVKNGNNLFAQHPFNRRQKINEIV